MKTNSFDSLERSEAVSEAATWIRARWDVRPHTTIILGTGLSGLADDVRIDAAFDYTREPHLPVATAIGHAGQLLCGRLTELPVLVWNGRCHLYEGRSAFEAALAVRVSRALGAEVLVTTSASGGLNPEYQVGDIVLIDDHINLLGSNPWIGPNVDRPGPRIPDMSRPYDPLLSRLAEQCARRRGITLRRGVYAAMLGPTYETPAEARFLRRIGADMAGLSLVPEVLAAVPLGLRVLAFSVITNLHRPGSRNADAAAVRQQRKELTRGEDVVAAAARAEPKLRQLVLDVLRREAER